MALQTTIPVLASATEEGERLLDTLPLAPQVLAAAIDQGQISLTDATTVDASFTDPPAGQIGSICGVTVRIVAFQPFATPIPNVTWPCHDGFYDVPGGLGDPMNTGDCGGRPVEVGSAEATLTASTVGTTATSAVIDRWLGTPLQPGQTPPVPPVPPYAPDFVRVVIHVPQAGSYTFSLNFWQDDSGPTMAAPNVIEAISLGLIAHRWGAAACQAANMQAQLPPPPPTGQPPLHVICPS
jgi:hypothetical protein